MTYYLVSAPTSGNSIVIASLVPEKATIYLGVEGDSAQNAIDNLFPLQLFSKGVHVRSVAVRPNTHWSVIIEEAVSEAKKRGFDLWLGGCPVTLNGLTEEAATSRAKCTFFLKKAKQESPTSAILWPEHQYLNVNYEWSQGEIYSDGFIEDVMSRIWTEGQPVQ